MSEYNPLVERVDALLKRHQQHQQPEPATAEVQATDAAEIAAAEPVPPADPVVPQLPVEQSAEPDDDIPVLTEIVDPDVPIAANELSDRALVEIEAALLEKLLVELDRAIETRLNRTIGEVVEQSMDGLRVDLSDRVRELVREAVATALAKEIAEHSRPA